MSQKIEGVKPRTVRLRVLSQFEEDTGRSVVDAAYCVHKELGPGLLERIYESCFCYELVKRGCTVSRQLQVPIVYQGVNLSDGLRLDVLVNNSVICEIKSVDEVNPVWAAQVLSQLRLTDKHLGYLINFNVPLIKQGIRRFIR